MVSQATLAVLPQPSLGIVHRNVPLEPSMSIVFQRQRCKFRKSFGLTKHEAGGTDPETCTKSAPMVEDAPPYTYLWNDRLLSLLHSHSGHDANRKVQRKPDRSRLVPSWLSVSRTRPWPCRHIDERWAPFLLISWSCCGELATEHIARSSDSRISIDKAFAIQRAAK